MTNIFRSGRNAAGWKFTSAVLALLLSLVAQPTAAQSFNPVAWPTNAQWRHYTLKDTVFADPRVQDPSNGGTSPQNYVNISSGTPDGSQPSIYFAFLNSTIFVRFRVESDPNAYSGNNGGNTDPWNSAQWIMMLDVNGDGWRDFAIFLDGASGTPSTPIDRIKIIYSRLTNTQSIESGTGIYLMSQVYGAQLYTSGLYTGKLKQYDGNANLVTPPWSGTPTTWDFGTSRIVDSSASGNQYFIDFQLPMSALDASAYNGPVFTTSTVFTAVFTTANSLNDPFQKDYAYIGAFCPSATSPFASGDPATLDPVASIPKIVVSSVAAQYCPTVNLSTTVITSQRLINCSTVASSVVVNTFYYWYDANENGLDDEIGQSWTTIADGTSTTLGTWTATWNTASLPRGKYLIKVTASDQSGNSTDSYTQTVSQYPNVYAVISNDCGIIPGILNKSVTPSTVQANLPASSRKVTYTVTVTNPQVGSIAIDTLRDILPSGFKYLNDTTGGTLSPTSSPTANSTGTVRWVFSPPESIAAGASKTLKFNVLADTVPGTFYNSVLATGSTYYNTAGNIAPVVVTSAAASLSKATSAVAGLNPGDTTMYTITYTNTGAMTLTNVTIRDSLVQGLSNTVTVYHGGTYDSTTRKITWNIGTVIAGASASVKATVRVKNPYNGVNPLINSATLTATQLVNTVTSNTVQNTVLGPVLSMSKSVSPTSVYPGNNVTYTILFGNIGTGPARHVVVRDTLPSNMTYVNGTSTPTPDSVVTISNPTRQVLYYSFGTVAAGGGNLNNTIAFQATVANPYPTVGANQALVNKAVISSDDTDPFNNSATLLVTAIPNVSLVKTSNQSVYAAGDSATFTLTLTNTGYYTATLDTLEDDLPNNFKYGRNSGGNLTPTTSPTAGETGTIRWRFSPAVSIVPGATKTLEFRVKTAIVGVNYTNVARARGVLTSASQGSISTTLPIGIAENEEVMVKSVNLSTVYVGDTLVYTLYYLNNIGSTQSRTMKDTLPSSVNYLNSTASQGTVSNSGNVITWTPGNVANGGSATLTIRTIVNQGGTTISNRGSFNRTPLTFTNTVTTTSLLAPAITFSKGVSLTSAPVGTELTYTINYSNAPGVEPSTNSIIADTLPYRMTYVVGSVTGGGSYTTGGPKGRVVLNLGTVDANTSGSLSFKVTIDIGAPIDTIMTNKAYFTNNEGTFKTATAQDTVKALPNLSITKLVDKVSAGPADTLTYTIKYKNIGTATANSVFIYDTIPAHTTFVSASGGGTLAGSVVTWNIAGSVAVNDSGQFALVVRLLKPMVYGSVTQISNTSYVAALGIADKGSTPALTNIIYPQLAAVKSVDSTTAFANSVLTYTIVVSNATIIDATASVLYDSIPTNTTYVLGSTKLNTVAQADVGGTSPLVAGLAIGTVTSSASKTVEFKVSINSPIINGTEITNSSYVRTDKLVDSIQGTSVSTSVISLPGLALTKAGTAQSNIPGDTLTYTLRYGNPGSDTAKSVAVVDTIPANTTYVSGSVTGTGATYDAGGNRILVSRTYLAAVDTGNIATFKVRVNSPLPSGQTTIRNDAFASATGVTTRHDSSLIVITATSTFSLTKSAPSSGTLHGTPTPADTFQFTLNYSISGTATVDSIYLRDTLAAGLTYVSSTLNSVDSGAATGQAWRVYLGQLSPGASGTATIRVRTTTPGAFANRARIVWQGSPAGTLSNSTTTTIIQPFTGSITASTPHYPGQTITISVADTDRIGTGTMVVLARNIRNNEYELVALTETGPSTGNFAGTIATVFDTTLNADNNGTFGVYAGDTIRTRYVDSMTAAGVRDSVFARSAILGGADAIVSTSPAIIAAGDSVTFTITDQDLNRVSGSAESYTVEVRNSAGETESLVFVETGVNTGLFRIRRPTTYGSGGTTNDGLFTVLPGDSLILAYRDTLTAIGGTVVRSAHTIVGSVVFGTSVKSLTDDNAGAPRPPDTLTYVLRVRQTGTVSASPVSIVDSLPAGVTILAGTVTGGGSVSGGVITWSAATILSGDSLILQYQVRIDSTIQNNVPAVNRAHVTANGVDQLLTATFTPVNAPQMSMTKSVAFARTRPGDTLTYTITYVNVGTRNATFVTVTDATPDHTIYVTNSTKLNNVDMTDDSDGDEVTLTGTNLQISVGVVPPGQSGTIKFKVRIQ